MANVEKEMRTRPAKWPLDTLEACVRDFLWRREPGGGMDVKADDIPAMCAEAPDFQTAVWIACASKRRNGKMHSHQTKVLVSARREFGYRIISHYVNKDGILSTPRSFAPFHDTLWTLRPAGIGPLTVYDVATRVGAYLELAPAHIYLHTGARQGWNALMGGRARAYGLTSRIHWTAWPVALQQLTADQAEDFLCTYRDTLKGIKRDASGLPA